MSSKSTPLSILEAALAEVVSLQKELREELTNLKNFALPKIDYPDLKERITEIESKIQSINLQVEQLQKQLHDHLADYDQQNNLLKEQMLQNQESIHRLSENTANLLGRVEKTEKIERLLCQSPTRQSPNYLVIRKYLQENDWHHANEETYKTILWLTNSKQYLATRDLNQLSRYDLSIIDYLWSSYSNNHFGLSVQLRLWRSTGLPLTHDYAPEKKLSSLLGWHNENLWSPPETTNHLEHLPIGYFPYLPLWIGFHSSHQSRILPRLRIFFTKIFPIEIQ